MRRNDRKRGNFALLFMLLITVLAGFAAIAIDLSYVRNARMQLSNAVDAAAHAAMIEYRRSSDDVSAREMAKRVAALNVVADKGLTLQDADITFGSWDFEARTFDTSGAFVNACQVSATRDESAADGPIDLFFAPIIGTRTADAAATATGAFRFREVMMVQDVTGSFQHEMDDGRTADVAFLDYMYSNQFPQDKIGLIVFANVAYEYDELQNLDSNYTTLRSHWVGNGVTTCTSCNMGYACADFNAGVTGIQVCHKCGQTDCDPATQCCNAGNTWAAPFDKCAENVGCADGALGTSAPDNEGTAPAAGLQAGVDALLEGGTPGNIKVLVFVGDGRPQCKVGGRGESMSDSCPAGRADEAYAQAERAEEENINIYSVSMYSGGNAADQAEQEAFMAALVTGSGRAYATTDSSDLEGILLDIARSLPVAIVE